MIWIEKKEEILSQITCDILITYKYYMIYINIHNYDNT